MSAAEKYTALTLFLALCFLPSCKSTRTVNSTTDLATAMAYPAGQVREKALIQEQYCPELTAPLLLPALHPIAGHHTGKHLPGKYSSVKRTNRFTLSPSAPNYTSPSKTALKRDRHIIEKTLIILDAFFLFELALSIFPVTLILLLIFLVKYAD